MNAQPGWKSRTRSVLRSLLAAGGLSVALVCGPNWALAQDIKLAPTPDTREAKAGAPSGEATGTKADAPTGKADEKPAQDLGKKTDVPLGEQLAFQQEKVAAEMTELEERMFRLSEAIKALEPENSSRLMLGLKYAREELILQHMKQVKEVLEKLALTEAESEQKELLAKLQRLQDLLLSTDLDFQLKLEQLRQLREIIKRLDTAIKEEDRELSQSKESAEAEKKLAGLQKRRKTLDEIIKAQTEHVAKGQELAKQDADSAGNEPMSLGKAQSGTKQDTDNLAKAAGAVQGSKNLDVAGEKMASAIKQLDDKKPKEALPEMETALEELKKEDQSLADAQKKLEQKLAAERFAAMKKDQSGNRQFTEGITDLLRQQGGLGANAMSELSKASGSMSGAEGAFGQSNASDGSEDQDKALAALKYAKEQLEQEQQKLLEQLRAEVKKRVLEGLTAMLEKQIAVREATVILSPKVAKKSRQAITALVAQGEQEQAIIQIADDLIGLVEETEFGIALPAAMTVVRDEMVAVRDKLADGDAGEQVVAAEQQIEEDLQSLMDAMKQMPSQKSNPKDQKPQSPQEQARELNRLVAELKLIRLLQVRINKDTTGVDTKRPEELDALSTSIKQQIGDLQNRQEDVRDVTERLAAERGQEISQ